MRMHLHENEYDDINKDKEAMIKEYETLSFTQELHCKVPYVYFVAAAQSVWNELQNATELEGFKYTAWKVWKLAQVLVPHQAEHDGALWVKNRPPGGDPTVSNLDKVAPSELWLEMRSSV